MNEYRFNARKSNKQKLLDVQAQVAKGMGLNVLILTKNNLPNKLPEEKPTIHWIEEITTVDETIINHPLMKKRGLISRKYD